MVSAEQNLFRFEDYSPDSVERQIFEAGRFAMQTNDPDFGPSSDLQRQHNQLAKDKIAAAKRRGKEMRIPDTQIANLMRHGAAHYLSSRRKP